MYRFVIAVQPNAYVALMNFKLGRYAEAAREADALCEYVPGTDELRERVEAALKRRSIL